MVVCTINVNDILSSLSTALDLTQLGLSGHHKRVAYMSLLLGKHIGLTDDKMKNLYLAAIMHDIGAISLEDKSNLLNLEIRDPFKHCEQGYHFIRRVKFLEHVSNIIKCHHHRWDGQNPDGLKGDLIPVESRIIHVVDRLDILANKNQCILEQTDNIIESLKGLSGDILDPDILAELFYIGRSESFWLDIVSSFLPSLLNKQLEDIDMMSECSSLIEIALLFARVIDSKSKFTHRHSLMVSKVAEKLAGIVGFPSSDIEKMAVAGLLHDLGKLSIPEEILEKPGSLSLQEFKVIKRHTYYTYRILEQVPYFKEINEWASYHHERLDGKGYPFHLSGKDLSQGSRILAVSDVFSALTEDRPYRNGLPQDKVESIYKEMVSGGALDAEIVTALLSSYHEFKDINSISVKNNDIMYSVG